MFDLLDSPVSQAFKTDWLRPVSKKAQGFCLIVKLVIVRFREK